jgi:hypothetical protein
MKVPDGKTDFLDSDHFDPDKIAFFTCYSIFSWKIKKEHGRLTKCAKGLELEEARWELLKGMLRTSILLWAKGKDAREFMRRVNKGWLLTPLGKKHIKEN